MEGYKFGTQGWFNNARTKLVENSKELRNPETKQERRNELYDEQIRLLDELETWYNDGLTINPIAN